MSRGRVAIGGFRGERGRSLARLRRKPRSRGAIVRRVLVVGAAAAAVAGGAWWLLTAPAFAVVRVESGPYRFSARAAVDSALTVALGRNIWRLGTAEVEAAFAPLPWVRTVHVSRRVPDTVRVELEEWRPLVAVADAGAGASPGVLVGDGRVLPFPAHLEPPALPLLVGASLAPDDGGTRRLDPMLHAQVRDLLTALAVTGFESSCPVDFIRVTPLGLTLELARRAGSLRLGREQYRDRLERFLLARDRVPHGAAVDLRFADRITFEPPAPGSS